VIAAVVLTAAAGLLQYSVSAGDRGINAYLSKEKGENPFYNYRSSRPPAQGRPRPGEEERWGGAVRRRSEEEEWGAGWGEEVNALENDGGC
jgi:hypothetical protein